MWFYWIITIVAACLVRVATACLYRDKRSVSYTIVGIVCIAFAVLTFCVVAGFRNPYVVGTDTAGYGIADFVDARDLSLDTFWTLPRLVRYTYMNKFIIWVISHFSRSFFVYLFVYELIICLPIIIVSVLYLKKNAWLAIIVFGWMIFPSTFNLMRQYQAEAFCLLTMFLLMRNKPIWSVISFVIACRFHPTALVMVPLFPIYYYLKWNNKIGFKNYYIKFGVLISCAIVGCVFFSKPIFTYLFSHSETYRTYVNETQAIGYALISFFIISFFIFTVMFALFKKKEKSINHEIIFLLAVAVIGVVAFSLGLRWQWLFRLGYYWYAACILLFPKMTASLEDKYEIIIFSLAIVIFLGTYSYVNFDLRHHDEVVPYVFSDNINIRL